MAITDRAYAVCDYSDDILVDILSQHPETSRDIVLNKSHTGYFHEYFGPTGVSAKTILIEYNYIDHDFLEDYSSFYVRCFRDYKSVCKRLHFFSETVTEDSVSAWLRGGTQTEFVGRLQRSYLGFIVVKPLPRTIIGRTCLKAYPHDGHRRHFPALRSYRANLFGLPLDIVDTLAFQEQDSVAAACATSALWSTFQATGKLFQHPIPSPVEITKAAHARFPMDERELPNHGLSIWQMAHAVSSVGLEPLSVKINDPIDNVYCLQSTAYAYLHGGIPVPFLVRLCNKVSGTVNRHAIAITGYSLGGSTCVAYGKSGFRLKASRVDEFYAHDDGVGPFARMVISPSMAPLLDPNTGAQLFDPATGVARTIRFPVLSTSWKDQNGAIGNIEALPEHLLIPLYHKVRIPFRTAMNAVRALDEFLKLDKIKKSYPRIADLEWDIYLTQVSKVKAEIAETQSVTDEYREAVLTQPMPKYVWRATAEDGGTKVLDVLLDATDIEQGPLMVRAIEYDPNIGHTLRECTKDASNLRPYELYPVRAVLKWFADQPV